MGEAKRRRDRGEDWTQRPQYAEERAQEQLRQIRRERYLIEDQEQNGAARRRAMINVQTPEDKRRGYGLFV